MRCSIASIFRSGVTICLIVVFYLLVSALFPFLVVYYGQDDGMTSRDDVVSVRKDRPPDRPNCRDLLEGNEEEVQAAKTFMLRNPRKVPPDSQIYRLTQNCQEFLRSRGYPDAPNSREEAEFPIAFSILMHKESAVTERLLRAIYQPQNLFCIHVDSSADPEVSRAVHSLAACFDNVVVPERLVNVVYASWLRLEAEMECMRTVRRLNQKWKYYINLVSTVFPLKTNREMVSILKIYNGVNDVEGLMRRTLPSRFVNRYVLQSDPKNPGKKMALQKFGTNPSPPHKLKIVRGSAYAILSRKFVEFILDEQIPRDLYTWSKNTYSPDEHYFATLHHLKANPFLKTPGGYHGDPDRKSWLAVYAAWGREEVDPCLNGKFVHSVCIFGVRDLAQLITRKELFANKFQPTHEYLAMDCLEEFIRNRTRDNPIMEMFYYRRLSFINQTRLTQPPRTRPHVQKNRPHNM